MREEIITYVHLPITKYLLLNEMDTFFLPLKELQHGAETTDEDRSAQGSNEQQPFLGFAGTVETDEDEYNIKEKQLQLIAHEEHTAFAASAFGTPA